MEEQTHASPQQQQTLFPEAESAGPVREWQRIHALDLLRGFAILGIFIVNIQLFSMPFASAMTPEAFAELNTADRAAWYFIKIFGEYKFVSLFSLLFGAGLIMQMTRARTAGAEFGWRYFRRIVILAVFGLIHAVLFWYGDILFIYAVIGSLLFFFRNLKPKTLLLLAGGFVIATAAVMMSITALQLVSLQMQEQREVSDSGDSAAAADEVDVVSEGDDVDDAAALTDFDEGGDSAVGDAADEEPLRGLEAISAAQFNVMDERWVTAETLAYSEGPFRDAMIFRIVSYAFALLFSIFGFGWHVFAMFLVGAALMKLNFFSDQQVDLQRKVGLAGLAIGLPLEILNAWLQFRVGDRIIGIETVMANGVREFGSVALCLGYTGIVCWIASSVRNASLHYPIRAVGRMALTTYLGSTLIATFLMYWWGLGWFGSVSRSEQLLIVGCVYIVLILASTIWLRFFRFGPFEWLWRVLTYARWQPLLR